MPLTSEHKTCIKERALPTLLAKRRIAAAEAVAAAQAEFKGKRDAMELARAAFEAAQTAENRLVYVTATNALNAQKAALDELVMQQEIANAVGSELDTVLDNWDILAAAGTLAAWCEDEEIALEESQIAEGEARLAERKAAVAKRKAS